MPLYPTALPDNSDYPNRSDDVDWIYAARYNEIKNELIAICAELGVSPSGASATVVARLALLALKSNVLELDNTDVFTPDADYEPATKKYVDDAGMSAAILNNLKDNILMNAFRIAINGALTKFNMEDGIMDEFEDESGVDTGTSTNESYDSADDYYSPDSGDSLFLDYTDKNTLLILGDLGDVEYRYTQSFTLSQSREISKVALEFGASGGSPSGQVTVRIETDSSGPSGALAHANATKAITPGASQWNEWDFTNFTLPAGTYWIVLVCDDQSTGVLWQIQSDSTGGYAGGLVMTSNDGGSSWDSFGADAYDLTFKLYIAQTDNMTLVSESTEAETEPDEVRLVVFEEDVDAITVNTDLKAYASRDDGANWVQATLVDEGDYMSGKRILAGTADISGQASDKTIKWKIESLNNKNLKVHAIGELWA